MTLWKIRPAAEPGPPGFHPLVWQALQRHGIREQAAAQAFLDPAAYTPQPPAALPGMELALESLSSAIRNKQRITIWGDFDVDGQTATTVLYEALTALNADVNYYIPVRARESHGVHLPKLKELIDSGTEVLLTCDTGISAHEAVAYANTRGVEVMITDHHDLPEELPPAAAITNPKLLPVEHPLAGLAGVGVAYKLAEGLYDIFRPAGASAETLLDLAALGLVADLALLTGDTRQLVQRGIRQLRITERAGLKALYEYGNIQPENINEGHIGFNLGPRLNALGRLEDANPAVELLSTRDVTRARLLAAKLESLNAQRKLLLEQVTSAAEAQLREDPSLLAQPVIVLHHPQWPGGVIGIAASRLVERYHKPAILLTGQPQQGLRGSARSVEGLHITEAIRGCASLLNNFGGHPMAAGLGLPAEHLPEFRKQLGREVEKQLGATRPEPEIQIDALLTLPEPSLELAAQLEPLSPFGPGNEKLTFATRNLILVSKQEVGKGREHLKLLVQDETGSRQTVMWWGSAGQELPEDGFDLAYSLRASDYRGQKQLSIELVDVRPLQVEQVEVRTRKLEILDLRAETDPAQAIQPHLQDAKIQVWAEGEWKQATRGRGRHELGECHTLAILTSPPSAAVLREALATAKPRRVILLAAAPAASEPQTFLERLAGLCKFVINQRDGKANLAELASATGQTEGAVRAGILWLEADGSLGVSEDASGNISLAPATVPRDESARARWQSTLQYLLSESAAYRVYYGRANPNKVTGQK